jgi:hypothetical protein
VEEAATRRTVSISEQSTAEAKALKEGEEERRDEKVAKMAVSISHDTTEVLAYQKCRKRENLPSSSSTLGAISRSTSNTESNASREERRKEGTGTHRQ